MEKVINIARFINDVMYLIETATQNNKDYIKGGILFDVNYYCYTSHNIIKMNCITLSHEFITEICGKVIKSNGYYIFYDVLKENFVFLKGSVVKKLKQKNPKNVSFLELVSSNQSFILDLIYIDDKLRKIPIFLSKLKDYELNEITRLISLHYHNFKEMLYSKQNKLQILLQTTYFVGNKNNITFYQFCDKHLLLSIQLTLIQEYSNLHNDKHIGLIEYSKKVKEKILKKFIEYGLANKTQYFHIYQYNITENFEKSINIYIDFEFDELVKLLFFIDSIEIIDKI